MAQLNRAITLAAFRKTVRSVEGLKISRPWLGYGEVLFLELGRITKEKHVIPGRPPFISEKGQATILFHCFWSAESENGSLWGMDSPKKDLKAALRSLSGRRVTGLALRARGAELEVELDREIRIRNYSRKAPDWDIFLNDSRRFSLESRFSGMNASPGVGFSREEGLHFWVCYDDTMVPKG